MKIYVSDIEKSYKDKIIGHMINSVTVDLLLHVVQCRRACAVNESNQNLHLVMYCLHLMYKYYYRLVFFPINHNEEGKKIHNEIFNNIPNFIKNCLNIDCLQGGFVMCNDKVIIFKIEVIRPITYSMITVDFCQKKLIHY